MSYCRICNESNGHHHMNCPVVKGEAPKGASFKSALDVQEGGTHYKEMPIQPVEFSHKNGLNFCQGNVVKYVCRYKNKNGKADLLKARHYIDLLIELEYGGKDGTATDTKKS